MSPVSEDAKTRWLAVAALVAAGMIAAGHIFKLSPAMPVVRAAFGLDLVAGGWLFSTTNILAALTGVAAGVTADRFGYRRVLFFGLAIMAVASALATLAAAPPLLFLCRLLEGAGFLSVVVSAPSLMVSETIPRDRPLALSWWTVYSPGGGSLTILLAPQVLRLIGWQGLWLTLSGVALAVLTLLASMGLKGRPHHGTRGAPFHRTLIAAVRHPGPWCAAGAFALYALQYVAVMAWLPSFLVAERGLSIALAAALTAVVMASNISGNLLTGVLLRAGHRHGSLITASSVLMAISALIIFSDLPDLARYLACVALSATGGVLPAAVLASAPEIAPHPAYIGAVNGLIVQGTNMGLLAGPPALAAVVALSGQWNDGLWLFLIAAAGAAALGLALNKVTGAPQKPSL